MHGEITNLRSWDLVYKHPQTGKSIFLGDVRAAQNLNFIHAQKINTIITAALGMDQLDYSAIHVKHIVYPLLDCRQDNLSSFFEHFFNTIERQIKLGSVLIHCYSGVSRSSALLIGYLMKKQDWSYRKSLQFIKKYRPQVQLKLGFEKQLKAYQMELRSKNLKTPRKSCQSSIAKRPHRTLNHSQHTEPSDSLSIGPLKSSTRINSLQKMIAPKKMLDFHVRSIRMRTIDSKMRTHRINISTVESEGGKLPNFDVVKMRLGSRAGHFHPPVWNPIQKC